MQIYLARNQVQAGPYTLEQLNNMLATQQVDLNDLMWHEGMSNWQRVGTLTNENYYYDPSGQNTVSHTNSTSNVTNSPTTSDKTVSVSRLYGKKEPVPTTKDNTGNTSKRSTPAFLKKKESATEIASVLNRILATIINIVLFSLCLTPISSSLDPEQTYAVLESSNQNAALMEMYQTVPQHLVLMSALLLLGLIIVQMALLVKKGQSIGKLATGIRILDVNTHKLPSANVVLLRAIFTSIIYYVTPLGLLVALIDLIVMVTDGQKRSIHDKLAKTYVVKAKPEQLDKTQ